MWEAHVFLFINALKKHVRSTCYLNNMCFSHANGHMSILYVNCRKFSINWFVKNLCSLKICLGGFFKWQKFPTNQFVGNFLQHTYKNDIYPLSMWKTHVFLLILLKKLVDVHNIKTICVSYVPRDTYHFYMWVVENFLQIDL
jgi:hypothetical protein